MKQSRMAGAAFWCTFGAAAAAPVSIAVSHTLLALALAALLFSGLELRFPPFKILLGLFVLGTVVSLLLADDPAAGRPQLRKFYVFLILLLVSSTFAGLRQVRWLVTAWIGLGTVAAVRGLVQFSQKFNFDLPGAEAYRGYVANRITGFMSHWMTFSGQEMMVLLLALALAFFGGLRGRQRLLLGCAALVVGLAIALSLTRGIWLGTAAGALYLMWMWRRWTVALVPAALVVVMLAGPAVLRDRLRSFLKPHGTVDSNEHRVVTWRTGVEMIRAHPLFGVGPEHVKLQFDRYVPEDIPRPLPEGWYGHLHNIYLHYAAERGIPTLLVLLALLGKVLWDWVRALRGGAGGGEARWLVHGGIALLIGVLVTGVFEMNLGDSEVLMMVLATIAGVYAGLRPAEP